MQTAMRFLVVCAAAISLTPVVPCWADQDTEAQQKAREALEQRLNELQSQPAQAPINSTPSKPAKKQKAPPPPAGPAHSTPAPTRVSAAAPEASAAPRNDFVNSAPTADPEATAKMRAALEKRLNELDSQEAQAPRSQPEEPVRTTQHIQHVQAQPVTQPRTTSAPPPPSRPERPVASKSFPPLTGPESPLSMDKQQRLAELLRKYRADEITPEQYHAERARILGEP